MEAKRNNEKIARQLQKNNNNNEDIANIKTWRDQQLNVKQHKMTIIITNNSNNNNSYNN